MGSSGERTAGRAGRIYIYIYLYIVTARPLSPQEGARSRSPQLSSHTKLRVSEKLRASKTSLTTKIDRIRYEHVIALAVVISKHGLQQCSRACNLFMTRV